MLTVLLISTAPAPLQAALSALPEPPRVIATHTLEEALPILSAASPRPLILAEADETENAPQDGPQDRSTTVRPPDLVDFAGQIASIAQKWDAYAVLASRNHAGRVACLERGIDDFLPVPPSLEDVRVCLHHYQRCMDWRVPQTAPQTAPRQSAVELERLVTIGRLAPSIVHSISNPMQAMRGALILAQEDAHDAEAVREYIALVQQELDRVSRLVQHVRQLYRPQIPTTDSIHTVALLQNVIEITREEVMRQKVRIRDALALDTPGIRGDFGQLHLALLSIMLNLTDAVGAAGGGEIAISGRGIPGGVQIQFDIVPRISLAEPPAGDAPDPLERLKPAAAILAVQGGQAHFTQADQSTCLRVEILGKP